MNATMNVKTESGYEEMNLSTNSNLVKYSDSNNSRNVNNVVGRIDNLGTIYGQVKSVTTTATDVTPTILENTLYKIGDQVTLNLVVLFSKPIPLSTVTIKIENEPNITFAKFDAGSNSVYEIKSDGSEIELGSFRGGDSYSFTNFNGVGGLFNKIRVIATYGSDYSNLVDTLNYLMKDLPMTINLSCNGGDNYPVTFTKKNNTVIGNIYLIAPSMTTATQYDLGTLPPYYRPSSTIRFPCVISISNGVYGYGVIVITPGGVIRLYAQNCTRTGNTSISCSTVFTVTS